MEHWSLPRNKLKILIMGLPGAGKTSLGVKLRPRIGAILFDGDDTRKVWPELGFAREDRIEQAKRMAVLCNLVVNQGFHAIATFVCPIPETRRIFNSDYTIWIDRIKAGRFEDTNKMFVKPRKVDLRLTDGSIDEWVERTLGEISELLK